MKTCACGCGAPVRARYVSGHNRRGERSERLVGQYGYILAYAPDHPRANRTGYVFEHILVAERALGRYLPADAVVHHVNEDKADNRPENLVICQDRAHHNLIHQRMRALKATGHADYVPCVFCGAHDRPTNLLPRGKGFTHRECRNRYHRTYHRSRRAKETI